MRFTFTDYESDSVVLTRNFDGVWSMRTSAKATLDTGVYVTPLGLRRMADAIETATQIDSACDPE